uniref:Uncharacterized protein n=1 Tax=Utricularia reniformis TaxID=192314 RepID=A0A1Y0B1B1_9LAMI|nr:hypothetical protein AEK19_MT1014 [Utricularia reniformis]ART31236.1 hypothetical protein AEK19_MT1014 [Utricularia reniformis]
MKVSFKDGKHHSKSCSPYLKLDLKPGNRASSNQAARMDGMKSAYPH